MALDHRRRENEERECARRAQDQREEDGRVERCPQLTRRRKRWVGDHCQCRDRRQVPVEAARDKLEAAAARVFQEDRLTVYLRNPQHVLGGKSPLAYCVDDASFLKCVELTLLTGRRRR